MINFVRRTLRGYGPVIDSFIRPIMKHLPEATVSHRPVPGALNVRFFTEFKPHFGVFMSHVLADKRWRDYSKVRGFDYICTSGPLWTQKYLKEGCPGEKILEVGYPKLDPLFQGEVARSPSDKIRILFAPTHTAIPEVSLDGRFDYKFPPDIELLTCPHPTRRGDHKVTLQSLVNADYVIADSGSMFYEALAAGKPVILCDWLVRDAVLKMFPRSFEAYVYEAGIGFHARNYGEIVDYVRSGLWMDVPTKEFIDGIFPPELRGRSGETAAKELKRIDVQ